MSDDVIQRMRKKIQRQIELEDKQRRHKLLRKRIELAHAGVSAFERKKYQEAVQCFHSYLKILEDWKGVGQGGLTPALFDSRKDLQEMLLISAIYWDLAKLYDRTHSADKRGDFKHFMEKYILFSKGMPFQPLCAETLRKYISKDKPRHMEDFKNAYKMLGGASCFVVTSLLDVTDHETLPRLWRFRDEVLMRTRAGRGFVLVYYRVGPLLASWADRSPRWIRRTLGCVVDRLAAFLA